jgi:hypothetical protein
MIEVVDSSCVENQQDKAGEDFLKRFRDMTAAEQDSAILELHSRFLESLQLLQEAANGIQVYRPAIMAMVAREGGSLMILDSEITGLEGSMRISRDESVPGIMFQFKPEKQASLVLETPANETD